MKETEIKFKIDENILGKLKDILKDIKMNSYGEEDEYFTTKEMLDNDTFLRIRKKKGKIFLQLKDITKGGGQTNDCYEADEIHMELTEENYEKIREMLKRTFPFNFIVRKTRSKGFLNGCEICFDKVDGLGDFLEIEGERENILEVCKKFGLNLENRDSKKGYAHMMAEKINLLGN